MFVFLYKLFISILSCHYFFFDSYWNCFEKFCNSKFGLVLNKLSHRPTKIIQTTYKKSHRTSSYGKNLSFGYPTYFFNFSNYMSDGKKNNWHIIIGRIIDRFVSIVQIFVFRYFYCFICFLYASLKFARMKVLGYE